MVSPVGMVLMDGNSGNMMQVSAVNRVLFDDWSGDLAGIESGYDSKMNTSYFLNPTDEEMIQICHSTKSTGLVKGANFVGATSGPDVSDGSDTRAYFITATGLIVRPDDTNAGTGTMWGLDSSYTLDGTTTSAGSTTSVIDTGATFQVLRFMGIW
jgi:hypothetical protein